MLQWLSALVTAASVFLVGLPGVGYVLAGVGRRRPSKGIVQRVARLRDLAPGKPVQVNVVGSRQDAWTLHAEEMIGRVWLVRGKGEVESSQPPTVTALTAICPHLGCTIQHDPRGQRFVCPCHRAAFALDGKKIDAKEMGETNHAPRAMDALECRLVQDEADNDWWVEITYEQFEQGLTKKVCKA